MNDQEINDPLQALREERADLSPSPEFAARVREGIDTSADARRAGWLSGWRWLVPAGAVAAVVIAVVVISRSRPEAPEQVIAQAPAHSETPVAGGPTSLPAPPQARRKPETSARCFAGGGSLMPGVCPPPPVAVGHMSRPPLWVPRADTHASGGEPRRRARGSDEQSWKQTALSSGS